jgi:hypothetical protein
MAVVVGLLGADGVAEAERGFGAGAAGVLPFRFGGQPVHLPVFDSQRRYS